MKELNMQTVYILLFVLILLLNAALTTYLYYGKVVTTLGVRPSFWSFTILRHIRQYVAFCEKHEKSPWFLPYLRYYLWITLGSSIVLIILMILADVSRVHL